MRLLKYGTVKPSDVRKLIEVTNENVLDIAPYLASRVQQVSENDPQTRLVVETLKFIRHFGEESMASEFIWGRALKVRFARRALFANLPLSSTAMYIPLALAAGLRVHAFPYDPSAVKSYGGLITDNCPVTGKFATALSYDSYGFAIEVPYGFAHASDYLAYKYRYEQERPKGDMRVRKETREFLARLMKFYVHYPKTAIILDYNGIHQLGQFFATSFTVRLLPTDPPTVPEDEDFWDQFDVSRVCTDVEEPTLAN